MFKILISLIVIFIFQDAYGWSGNIYKHIKSYNTLHKKFFKNSCSSGEEQKYQELLKNYRGDGFYIPILGDDVDFKAIEKNIVMFKKKIRFIKRVKDRLKKEKSLPSFGSLSENIKNDLDELLKLKQDHSHTVSEEKKRKIEKISNGKLVLLRKHFDTFLNSLYFLKSYNFPNDHLANRIKYDSFKDLDGDKNKHKANEAFFYRKIVEDGAYDKDRTYPDIYLRSTLDTLYLSLLKERGILSENVRYDLDWVLSKVERMLQRGYLKHLERIDEWYERSKNQYNFYQEIISRKNYKKIKQIIKNKNKASESLKKFVNLNQAKTYKFWMQQSDLMKKLFVLETILYNEVGVIDGRFALERKDVAQVVINRADIDFYSSLKNDQPLVGALNSLNVTNDEIKKERWLNTLFKVGEFSFTYYYISSVAKIFCPDMSSRGRSIRSFNLKLALKALKKPKKDFNALRYFSRVSMLGKIDMSAVWKDFKKLAQVPGIPAERQRRLINHYKAGQYQYLYSFNGPSGREYEVVEIKDTVYCVSLVRGKPSFYTYRSPHLFTYFANK